MRLAEDEGFTRLPEICAILDRYERPDAHRGRSQSSYRFEHAATGCNAEPR